MANLKWNYTSAVASSTGYEDVLGTLKQYTQKDYLQATAEEQVRMVNEVYEIYRTKNIFPIVYYNEAGAVAEVKKVIDRNVSDWDGKVLGMKLTQGSSLCKWLMPNMFNVVVRDNPDTQYKRFYQEEGLKKAIAFCLRYDTGVKPNQVQAGLRMTSSVATNFPPMRAKALWERFAPANGVVLDYAHGFGGRLLGALASKKNLHYIGIDPNTETSANVNRLGQLVEKATGRTGSYELHCMGSEEYAGADNSVDFAFSSPPYFNLERYTEEDTQSYNKFDEVDAWLEGYVRPTIKMLHRVLKDGAYYGVNIADFKIGSKTVSFVDDWIRISEEEGFTYDHNIPMKLQTRTGNRDKGDKAEGVFIFKK
jgi:hypothetical protein